MSICLYVDVIAGNCIIRYPLPANETASETRRKASRAESFDCIFNWQRDLAIGRSGDLPVVNLIKLMPCSNILQRWQCTRCAQVPGEWSPCAWDSVRTRVQDTRRIHQAKWWVIITGCGCSPINFSSLYSFLAPFLPLDTYGLRVGNCFAFDKKNITLKLTDDRG